MPGPAGGGELIGFLRAASSVRPGPAGRADVVAASSVQTSRQTAGSGTVRRTIALVNDIMVVNDIVLVNDQAPRFQ
ncbi:hypothetical protein HMPREF0972_02117 [Actinomyces sp. oral taxon 848 str. F0332]|nr:hypothetical protein HMPREF0972_02117 [Actinomyces sp. oral taxon 848 str. F0332]